MPQSISGVIHYPIEDTDGVKRNYSLRTGTVYRDLGTPGTIVADSAKTTVQLDLGGLSGYVNIAERNASGGWDFTANAGALLKQKLTERGPGSLTAQLDNATVAALKTNAKISDVQAKQALDITQNITGQTSLLKPNQNSDDSGGGTDPPVDGADTSGSSIKLSPEQAEGIKSLSGAVARGSYENLNYPKSYDGNDFLQIKMIRYVSGNLIGVTGDNQADFNLPSIEERSAGQLEKPLSTINLPIPANLTDGNLVNWRQDDLNAIQAYTAEAISGFLNSSNLFAGAGAAVGNAAKTIQQNSEALRGLFDAKIVGDILGANKQSILTRGTGAVLNPNTELLFEGPSLRTFVFSFKMTPRNKEEATEIKKIIRTLKQGMSVKRAVSTLFLASPNVFKLEFKYVPPEENETSDGKIVGNMAKAVTHPFLPKIKICALQSMSVNYMPDGSYMTYGDGSMIGYDMSLTFREIDPVFDDDYGTDDYDNIGY